MFKGNQLADYYKGAHKIFSNDVVVIIISPGAM